MNWDEVRKRSDTKLDEKIWWHKLKKVSKDRRKLVLGVDSGAAVSVIPRQDFVDCPLLANERSSSGKGFFTADGGRAPDEGHCPLCRPAPDSSCSGRRKAGRAWI